MLTSVMHAGAALLFLIFLAVAGWFAYSVLATIAKGVFSGI